jgi:uncharacterized damage-inducible protein DinB
MDLLDRMLGHDAWTTRHLLTRCAELSEADLHRPFDLGHGSVTATARHLVGNVEGWTAAMLGRTSTRGMPDSMTVSALIERFDAAYAEFVALARRVRDEGRWDEQYTDPLGTPPRPRSFGGTILHVATHSMGHRSEILHMLGGLGVADLIEGDALGWENRHRFTSPNRT